MKHSKISTILFSGKRNIPWGDVEKYLSKYAGGSFRVAETDENVRIGSHFAEEYCGSVYTKGLRGTLEKAKANAAQIIPDLIRNATNRRWVENKDEKHKTDAKGGWYRYDVFFSMPVTFDGKTTWNSYKGTAVARINDSGIFLHDIINIKKEDSKPFESK